MFPFFQNRGKQLQEQQNIIYNLVCSGDRATELEEYFNIYLSLMGRYAGDPNTQLLIAKIFAKYAGTFIQIETSHLSSDQVAEMRAAAKRMMLSIRDGRKYPSSE